MINMGEPEFTGRPSRNLYSSLTCSWGNLARALLYCPSRTAVPAASCSRTPSAHPKPIPTFQMTGGLSSKMIIWTDTSAATAATNVPMALASAIAFGPEPVLETVRLEDSKGMLVSK